MGTGKRIKRLLFEQDKTQRWLSAQTGIDYDKLNLSLNDRRVLSYEELETILWALNADPSEIIVPKPPLLAG